MDLETCSLFTQARRSLHGYKASVALKSTSDSIFFIHRTRRMWHPNVSQKKHYYSDILSIKLKLRVTTAAMRCIDKAVD